MRKTSTYTGTVGRDTGKQFEITEMPAAQAEKWAVRAILALGKSGIQMPDRFEAFGMEGVAALLTQVGLRGLFGMQFAEAEPLLDEMMSCVVALPDPTNPAVKNPMIDMIIEEVPTRLALRSEVINLHVGFSVTAWLQKWGQSARMTAEATPPTRTSPKPSARPSRPARHR